MLKRVFRFDRLVINRETLEFKNLRFLPDVLRLYYKYFRYLEDDFSTLASDNLAKFIDYVEKIGAHFYLVLSEDELCGFFLLERIVGNRKILHSAEVVTCFYPKYWGTFTKYAGAEFAKYCFEILGFLKLKAIIYPQNSRVLPILKACGFKKEALLKGETIKDGLLQDVEIYAVFNTQIRRKDEN